MAVTKEQKTQVLKSLAEILKGAASIAFVNFHTLGAANTVALRKTLRERGVRYFVAKKTLIQKTLGESSITGTPVSLEGEIALAYSDEEMAPAREVWQFAKSHGNVPVLMGGIFDGQYRDASAMTAIATIPSREVLYGQLVQLIASPLSGLVIALSVIAKSKE